MKKESNKLPHWLNTFIKFCLVGIGTILCLLLGLWTYLCTGYEGLPFFYSVVGFFLMLAFPIVLGVSKVWKKGFKAWFVVFLIYIIPYMFIYGKRKYNEYITVQLTPSVEVEEYVPFEDSSKLATLDCEAQLQLTGTLPIVDGEAAAFPLYAAFVHATYPDSVSLNGDDGTFRYRDIAISKGMLLADKDIDILFGGYPSTRDRKYAKEQGTSFIYTPIAQDAVVFVVHKDNPVESLTTEQIQGIYAGEITNWNEVGGKNEKIFAFQSQTSENGGCQRSLEQFLDGRTIMVPPKEKSYNFFTGSVGEGVAEYKNIRGAIGFSLGYWIEEMDNPDIKVLRVDGIEPTVDNIKNGTYPITTYIYAITYSGNRNRNTRRFIDWILSDEGQNIVEQTGYVGIGE